MIMEYLGIIIVGIAIVIFMYISHLKDINKDLRIQKQNLQTKIIKEKVKSNIKEFQSYQKAKKEEIKKEIKKEENETKNNDVNLSLGTHIINF